MPVKRIILIFVVVAGLSIAAVAYFRFNSGLVVPPEAHLENGRRHFSRGEFNHAAIEFGQAVKADPASAVAHYELGLTLLRLGKNENAEGEFLGAIAHQPAMMPPRYQLAHLYLQRRDVRRVKEQLDAIQRYEPNSVDARRLIARVALLEKDPDRALMELAEAVAMASNRGGLYTEMAAIYGAKKDFKNAAEHYRKALEIDPKLIEASAALTRLYMATGEQAKADQELLRATEADPENEALLHLRANEYSAAERYEPIEKLYLELLKNKPQSLVAKKRLAEYYILKGDLEKGWAYTHSIHNARPGDADATYFYGRLHLAQKEWARATEVLFNATRAAPSFAFAYYYLGQARLGTNDMAQARTSFTKAKELSPLWTEPRVALARIFLAQRAYTWAVAESEPVLQAQPRHFDTLTIAGIARLKSGEPGKALELFHRAKEINPRDAALHSNIGAVYLAQKKYGPALTAFEEALALGPDNLDALAGVAQVLTVQGSPKEALERVRQQLAKTKNHAEVYQLLGQLSVDRQDHEAALNYLAKAVALKPDLYSASLLIASTLMAQKKFDQAIAQAEKTIQSHPSAPQAYLLLANLHDRKQQYDQANRYYKKVLELDKSSALAANSLAWNYAEHGGNLDVALTLAQKARELSPEDGNVAHTLGRIFYQKGNFLKAINLLKESSGKLQDRNPTVLYHLGLAYGKNGDGSLAKESFLKALKLDPNFAQAKEAKQALHQMGERKS